MWSLACWDLAHDCLLIIAPSLWGGSGERTLCEAQRESVAPSGSQGLRHTVVVTTGRIQISVWPHKSCHSVSVLFETLSLPPRHCQSLASSRPFLNALLSLGFCPCLLCNVLFSQGLAQPSGSSYCTLGHLIYSRALALLSYLHHKSLPRPRR